MVVKTLVRKGEYYDSVTLMRVAKFLSEQKGVVDSAVVMATQENRNILVHAGLQTPELESATETDLVLAVKAESPEQAHQLLVQAEQELRAKNKAKASAYAPKSLDSALEVLPGANLALISVAGRYAGDEAMKALKRGLHVMLFSDNVPIEKEVELKTFAASKGLLVMGPDAGTAIINGVPLAFANSVKRGPVGIVAASGTGLQEASCLISNRGSGISQAIGTGGRDVKKEVGGIMFLQAVKALLGDPSTKVLLLISKPPHESVLKKISDAVKGAKKPVVATFLGARPETLAGSGMLPCVTLAEGAIKAAALAEGKSLSGREEDLDQIVSEEKKKLRPGQKYLRGLYTGGTFVAETLVLAAEKKVEGVYSNAPFGGATRIRDALKSEQHTVIDFGEDEFTVGRPHPMIDFSLRNKRILEEARDAEVAVLLLDLVLGWGAHPDPLPDLLPVLKEAGRSFPIVMSVTGTDSDPQNRAVVVRALKNLGVRVAESNAQAARLALAIAEGGR